MDGGRAAAVGGDPSPIAAPSNPPALSSRTVDVSSFTHTPCYCEENVYMLCKELIRTGVADPAGTDLFVVFISNEEKKVPLWHQKAGHSDDGFICWDYHVICIQSRRSKGEVLDFVWDLDSDLPLPSPFIRYVSDAIQPLSFGNSRYARGVGLSMELYLCLKDTSAYMIVFSFPGTTYYTSLPYIVCRLFRVIHAPVFLRSFASDRSHMKDPEGNWIQLPPKYEPIVAEDGTTNNLNEYILMSAEDVAGIESMATDVYYNKHGVVLNETILPKFFAQLPCPHT